MGLSCPPSSKQKLCLLLPVLVVGLVYLPALRGGFVWDDAIFPHDISLYHDPTPVAEALQQPFVLSLNYFRPLASLTFITELRPLGLGAPAADTRLGGSAALLRWGKLDATGNRFRRAVERAPDWALPCGNLAGLIGNAE